MILGTGYSYEYDYWSLGVILFECLFGPKPFGEEVSHVIPSFATGADSFVIQLRDTEHLQIFNRIVRADSDPLSFHPFLTPQLDSEERDSCEQTISALLCYDSHDRAGNIRRISEVSLFLEIYSPNLLIVLLTTTGSG